MIRNPGEPWCGGKAWEDRLLLIGRKRRLPGTSLLLLRLLPSRTGGTWMGFTVRGMKISAPGMDSAIPGRLGEKVDSRINFGKRKCNRKQEKDCGTFRRNCRKSSPSNLPHPLVWREIQIIFRRSMNSGIPERFGSGP